MTESWPRASPGLPSDNSSFLVSSFLPSLPLSLSVSNFEQFRGHYELFLKELTVAEKSSASPWFLGCTDKIRVRKE